MKPADHPEFFRLPPPEGRSRESTIVLDGEGRFWHAGTKVAHPGMARAFASWVARHPDDGRYILNNGYDWTYFAVEDTPFFVERVSERPGAASLVLELSDGSSEALDPAALAVGRGGALVVPVKARAFTARFTRSAQLSLAPYLVEREDGGICLELAGKRWELPQVPPEAC
jgi:hypothetical protein